MINGKTTTFDKSSFYAERDSYYYLLLNLNVLENVVNLIHKVMESRLCKLYAVHTKDGKGVMDQRYLTEKLMNKLQNLYGISQLKPALGVVRLHFIIHWVWLWKLNAAATCSAYVPPDYMCNYWNDLDDYQEKLRIPLFIHQMID